jgi:hypothetical protein
MSISLAHCITQKNHFFTSAQPLGSRSLVARPQACPLNRSSFPLHYIGESSGVSRQLSAQRRLIHHLHFCLMTMHPTLWNFTRSPCDQPQARPTLQISFLTALHRRNIWSSSQLSVRRRPSLRSSSVSDRNHTPLSGALSQVYVLENVSHTAIINKRRFQEFYSM